MFVSIKNVKRKTRTRTVFFIFLRPASIMMFEESQSSLLSARQHNKAKWKEEQKSYTTMESRALDDKQHETWEVETSPPFSAGAETHRIIIGRPLGAQTMEQQKENENKHSLSQIQSSIVWHFYTFWTFFSWLSTSSPVFSLWRDSFGVLPRPRVRSARPSPIAAVDVN